MAIYRIFPEKDTFIYTEQLTSNAGKDEIVEIAGYPGTLDGTGQTNRILTKFSDVEIKDVILNKVTPNALNSMSSSIKMYLASATELPTEYTLYAYPIHTNGNSNWDNGTGKFGDIPVNTSGASWTYRESNLQSSWNLSNFTQFTTASFVDGKQGGGNWYTASNAQSMEFSQLHDMSSTHDMDINVTPAIKQMYGGTLSNKGFIVKLQKNLEHSTTSTIKLKYFGKDTNTIYPPVLEFGWDDRVYNQGTLSVLDTDMSVIDIKNNKGEYADEGKQRFRITAKPQYPTRRFTTSSVYLDNYVLPSASYWGLRDENTEEMVVDFSTDFTKISCDPEGSFFDIYMDGLQPERFYRILVKTEAGGSNVVSDNRNIFKIVRNG